jgi:GNAT superfamily N-acetyltransferase
MMADTHIEINCSEPIIIHDDEDKAQEYLYDRTIEGKIYLFDDDEEVVGEVGKMWLYILNGNQADCANDDIKDWCEEHSNDMYDYIKPVYKDGKIKKEYVINKRSNNILIFHWLEIYKDFRKCGYGEKIVQSVLKRFGENCGAILVHPHPLQYSKQAEQSKKRSEWMKKMKFTEFKNVEEKEAFKKVTGFWKRMGFKKIPRSDIYYYVN